MTFDARESSRTLGEPVELYFFQYGDKPTNYYAYNDKEQPVVYNWDPIIGPVSFTPATITRDDIEANGTLDKSTLTVTVPQDNTMVARFRLFPPSQVVILTIFSGHVGEAEFKLVWKGRLLGSADGENDIQLTCEPASISMKRSGARRNYQRQCSHPLYDPLTCKANKAAATAHTLVQGIAGPLITLPANWDTAARKPKYLGGFVTWTAADDGRTEVRSIVGISADLNTLTLSGITLGLNVNGAIAISLGCNHVFDPTDLAGSDCLQLHNNVHNYGGQFGIPLKNPFGLLNNFN